MPATRGLAATLAVALAITLAPRAVAATSFGPQLPDNPHNGPTGSAAMHGDSGASDTTPLAIARHNPLDKYFYAGPGPAQC